MKEILIERKDNILRAAIKVNGKLEECLLEENTNEPKIGEIYKGRIKNIIHSTNSIFIDLGLDKEGYLYLSSELKEKNLKKGDEVLVEILKEAVGDKGPKVSNKISLPGKYFVVSEGFGVIFSKRITLIQDIERINKLITPQDGIEIVIRTDAVNASTEELASELEELVSEYKRLQRELRFSLNIGKVYGSNLILNRIVRDKIKDTTKIIVSNQEDYAFFEEKVDPVILQAYSGERSLFEVYNIESEILKLRHKKVNLPCGGTIVIERTEAMYVIDVNSGKNIKGKSFEKTILQTNIEAAKEIGRQIKLRNLGGIILIDFIDLRNKEHKDIVLSELRKSLIEDKGNTKIFPFTELGLVQIARKRVGKSIYEYIDTTCKNCNGEGHVLSLSYIQDLIKDHIIKGRMENDIKAFYIKLNTLYKEEARGNIFEFLKGIDALNTEIYLNFEDEVEGFTIEPLIFQSQKDNVSKFLVKFNNE